MSHARSQLGASGEELAADYLEQRGYEILERNVRTAFGELDLVCVAPRPQKPFALSDVSAKLGRRRELVFVEVKTRRTRAFGPPEAAVTTVKQRHLVRSAAAYLRAHPSLRGVPYRIDVVGISLVGERPAEITHLRSAVGEDGEDRH